MERKYTDAPIDVAKERGGPPVPTKLDQEFGRTVTVDPRGGWKEVYCCKNTDGTCACGPSQALSHTPISVDDPLCREKIIEAGLKNRQIGTP